MRCKDILNTTIPYKILEQKILSVQTFFFSDEKRPPTKEKNDSLVVRDGDDPVKAYETYAAKEISHFMDDLTLGEIADKMQRNVKPIENGTILGGGLHVMFMCRDKGRAVFISIKA